ncbi:TetR/AcrR family transcriptional regulator [Sediminivirga luteola]|uniref:TetR/AcrR family transcriptional regulator n=1 Tax=Sediminivirga luteola TaxID=1774748 RepID=UPI001F55FFB6|nr:TetR/AcrR family transcriptional regulator [Sediminivirga luteola]MCI2265059.1 TetR/AcrR family transcriptional regulator [Sediminivirga luteola]
MSETRERILDAYERILIAQGERAATLEAVAEAADLSKGGLLYHFGSKAALVEGLMGRLRTLAARDVERMGHDARGAIDYFLRSSIITAQATEQTFLAAQTLVLAGDGAAAEAVLSTEREWLRALEERTGDPVLAKIVLLVGDGLYFGSSLVLAAEAAGAGTDEDGVPARTSILPDDTRLAEILETLLSARKA